MLVTAFSFFYIGLLCLLPGIAFRKLFYRLLCGAPAPSSAARDVMTGVVLLTVYAEYFSLIYKVGMVCHLLLWALCVLSAFYARAELAQLARRVRRFAAVPIGGAGWLLLALAVLLLVSFFASHGAFHTDTGIYHAQAIRLYEEYGYLKGVANLQLHFGYNSSYLAFAALFTLSWLLPFSLHTTTGFLTFFLTHYALWGLRGLTKRRSHLADGVRLALLLYVFTNITGAMSPATDYGTMYLVLYLLLAWAQEAEKSEDGGVRSLGVPVSAVSYGLLAVLSLFIVSMKFSAAALVLLALWPLYLLCRREFPLSCTVCSPQTAPASKDAAASRGRMLKNRLAAVSVFLLTGLLAFLPFLIRNYYISGWLFYPFESLDLFDVPWKVPVAYSLVDSNQIKVWGRALEDVTKIDWGFFQWFPVWWRAQEVYARMLMFSSFFATVLLGVTALLWLTARKRDAAKRIAAELWTRRGALLLFYAAVYVSLALWFFTAPFIRYGLAFLLVLPCTAICLFADTVAALWGKRLGSGTRTAAAAQAIQNGGRCSSQETPASRLPRGKRRKQRVLPILLASSGLLLCLVTALCLVPHVRHYAGDALKFVREYGADPYWLLPRPFPQSEMAAARLGGSTVYYTADDSEVNSYYVTPSTCYKFMLDRTELLGETVKEGFGPKTP